MFEEEFEFTAAEFSSVGASTLRCSLGKGDLRHFGVGSPNAIKKPLVIHRMKKMATFNVGDNLHSTQIDTSHNGEESGIASRTSVVRGENDNSFIFNANDDLLALVSPAKPQGSTFADTNSSFLTIKESNNRNFNRASPTRKTRLETLNKYENPPSVIKEEDPIDAISIQNSHSGYKKPEQSVHGQGINLELITKSNQKKYLTQKSIEVTKKEKEIGGSHIEFRESNTPRMTVDSGKPKSKADLATGKEDNTKIIHEANNDSFVFPTSIHPKSEISNVQKTVSHDSNNSHFAIKEDNSTLGLGENMSIHNKIELKFDDNVSLDSEGITPMNKMREGGEDGLKNEKNETKTNSVQFVHQNSYLERQKSTQDTTNMDKPVHKQSGSIYHSKNSKNSPNEYEIITLQEKIKFYKQKNTELDQAINFSMKGAGTERSSETFTSAIRNTEEIQANPEEMIQKPQKLLETSQSKPHLGTIKKDDTNSLAESTPSSNNNRNEGNLLKEEENNINLNSGIFSKSGQKLSKNKYAPLTRFDKSNDKRKNSNQRESSIPIDKMNMNKISSEFEKRNTDFTAKKLKQAVEDVRKSIQGFPDGNINNTPKKYDPSRSNSQIADKIKEKIAISISNYPTKVFQHSKKVSDIRENELSNSKLQPSAQTPIGQENLYFLKPSIKKQTPETKDSKLKAQVLSKSQVQPEIKKLNITSPENPNEVSNKNNQEVKEYFKTGIKGDIKNERVQIEWKSSLQSTLKKLTNERKNSFKKSSENRGNAKNGTTISTNILKSRIDLKNEYKDIFGKLNEDKKSRNSVETRDIKVPNKNTNILAKSTQFLQMRAKIDLEKKEIVASEAPTLRNPLDANKKIVKGTNTILSKSSVTCDPSIHSKLASHMKKIANINISKH